MVCSTYECILGLLLAILLAAMQRSNSGKMADPILIDESHLEASQHQFVNLAQLDELCEEHSYVLPVVQRIVASLVSGLALLFNAAAFPRGCYVPCLLEFLEHFGKWWLLLFHGRLLADIVFFSIIVIIPLPLEEMLFRNRVWCLYMLYCILPLRRV